ncbi:hypothetical protein QR685DRAFT_445785 [Neurospora intermedia]|uniref:Uncharacterized protein n=1 Tax=Neurospora intermedia TaxID=5142 RepID=A0ABR3D8Y5_NEUIN
MDVCSTRSPAFRAPGRKQQVIQTQYEPQVHTTQRLPPARPVDVLPCKSTFAATAQFNSPLGVLFLAQHPARVDSSTNSIVVAASSPLTARAPVSQAGSSQTNEALGESEPVRIEFGAYRTLCPERPSPAPQQTASQFRQSLRAQPLSSSSAEPIRRPFTGKMAPKPLPPFCQVSKTGNGPRAERAKHSKSHLP